MQARARRVAVALLLAIAVVRIAATYTRFSETADEPMHLTAGLQIFEGAYDIHPANPPLPRALTALGPWLAGARFERTPDIMEEVLRQFYEPGPYERMLLLARLGTLPFFLVAALATWAWARRELGEPAGLWALLLFTTQPVILGHAGLATMDVAATSGLAVSLFAFSRWLERPRLRAAAGFGIAFGFAILTKLLCLAYVPAACGAILLVRAIRDRQFRSSARAWPTLALALPAVAFVVWAGYGFTSGVAHGVRELVQVNAGGFQSYALGRVSYDGWWWYFPLAVALKTTLASLILVLLGVVFRARDTRFQEALASTLAILLLVMPTNVNLGVRYVLPLFVPLTLAATVALLAMFAHRARLVRIAAAVLLAWHLIASFAAHPHAMAYFNELAGRDPSRYLIDSNLDWGQDVLELRDVLREERIDSVGVSLFGPARLDRLGFPPYTHLHGWTPTAGWIAISDHAYRMGRAEGQWWWLAGRPYRRVGRSIRLYHR